MAFVPVNKIIWTDAMISFLRDNFHKLTNFELAASLELKLTSVRTKCYELGLTRMELEYWNEEQIQFLRDNYQEMGDMEIAQIFDYVCPKNKSWTLKHIEKKRKYLGLKRSPQEIARIKKRNGELGCWNNVLARGRIIRGATAEDGAIKYWRTNVNNSDRKVPMMKVNGKYVHWARHRWVELHGSVPEGMNVVFKDNDPFNTDTNNLQLLSNAELSKRNSLQSSTGLSDNYIAGVLTAKRKDLREDVRQDKVLIELKRKQLQLNRAIHEQQISNC